MMLRSYRASSFGRSKNRGRNGGRVLQRRCDCGNRAESSGECSQCAESHGLLQRESQTGSEPLDAATRGLMEDRFGRDFSGVRIHRDAKAHKLAGAMNAFAVTNQANIYFASGGYAPATPFGRAILGHELAHVAQNESAGPKAPASSLESEAARAATAVGEGQHATVAHSSNEPLLAITRGEKTAAGAAIGAGSLGAVGAGIGLLAASQMSGQPFGLGAAIGGLIGIGAGAIAGGLIGFFSRRTDPVEANEADAVIRRRFGDYLPGGVGPLRNAPVHPVDHSELCLWYRCRFGPEAPCEAIAGWTDVGREPPNQIESAEAEPICANGRQLEHGTPERPVIYFDRSRRDPGLMVHEGLHVYTHPSFGVFMRNEATEGTTEYFTRQVLDDINVPRGNIYEQQLAEVNRLIPVAGEDRLRRAYFLGEMDVLNQTANQLLGPCALSEWALAVQVLEFDRERPRQILEGRNQNYCAAGETSNAAPMMAPPPGEESRV